MIKSPYYTLTIDGNYFIRRVFARVLGNGHTFQEETKKTDEKVFIKELSKSLAVCVREGDGYINNVVIARDSRSWRKQLDIVRPIEAPKEKGGYKENRSADEQVNWKNLYATVDKFFDVLNDKADLPVVKTEGAEADDILYVASSLLNQNGIRVMLWSSDGDISGLVTEDTLYFKLPKKKIYCHVSHSAEFEQRKTVSIFDKPESSTTGAMRKVASAIGPTNPFYKVITSISHGDAKDNCPPLFQWLGGTKKFKPSARHIDKALVDVGLSKENVDMSVLLDMELMTKYVQALFARTKQTRDLEHTMLVFKSNRKLVWLNKAEIPRNVIEKIVMSLKYQFKKKPDLKAFKSYQKIYAHFNMTEQGSIFEALLDD